MKNTVRTLLAKISGRRVLSLVLSVSLLVTTLVTPVAAAGQEPEETAAEELLSALKDYLTSSKEEAAEEPAPEETENTALPAEDTVDETPDEILSMSIETPTTLKVYKADENGEAQLSYDGTANKLLAAAAQGVPTENGVLIDWTQFDLSTIAEFDGGELSGGILYFMLNHRSDESQAFKTSSGDYAIISGISNYSYLEDGNHDGICDTCERCIGGCTYDETPYTSKDVKTREGGFLYNAAGDVIGVECTVEVETTEGTKTQTIDKYYTYVADGAVCAACGGVYCAEHDFTNGFCDACGRDIPGKAPVCTDGNMDGRCDTCRRRMPCAVCADGNDDDLCDTCCRCVGECTDAVGGKDGLPDGLCDVCGACIPGCLDVDGGTPAGDGKCDHCLHTMRCAKCNDDNKDGVCDVCGFCTADCIDAEGRTADAPDEVCDNCLVTMKCETCADGNNDGQCDTCTRCMSGCKDETGDDRCDVCHACMNGCTDDTGSHEQVGDGVCDRCGFCKDAHTPGEAGICSVCGLCVNGCVDELDEEGFRKAPDGVCDRCEKAMTTEIACTHQDKSGAEACKKCGVKACTHMTGAQILLAVQNMTTLFAHLETLQTGNEALASWLDNGARKQELLGETATDGKLGWYSRIYRGMSEALRENAALQSYLTSVDELEADKLNGSQLVGTFSKVGGELTFNNSGTHSAEYSRRVTQYNKKKADAPSPICEYYKLTPPERSAKIGELALAVLQRELKTVFPDTYSGGPLNFSQDETLIYRSLIKGVEESLLYYLWGNEYKDTKYTELANKVWAGATLPTDPKDRCCTLFDLLDQVDRKICELAGAAFTSFKQLTYNKDDTVPYAIRSKNGTTMAEDYIVDDSKIQQMISAVDGFLSSPEFVRTLHVFNEELDISKLKDLDKDGIDLYDLLIDRLSVKLLNDESVSKLITKIFSSVEELLNDLPDLISEAEYIDYAGNGLYAVDIFDMLGRQKLKVDSWFTTLLGVLGTEAQAQLSLNGGKARKLVDVLSENHIYLTPAGFATAVSEFNNGGKYDAVISKLQGVGSWNNVGTMDFGIKDIDDVRDVLAMVLNTVRPLAAAAFGGDCKLELDDVAQFDLNATVIYIIPFFMNFEINANVDMYDLRIYSDVIVPILEALGVSDFKYEDLNYSLDWVWADDSIDSMREIADAILNPVKALLKQFAEHPLEKILSILPNLALYLESGKLLELLNIDQDFSVWTDDMNPSASDLGESYVDMLENFIFEDWWDYLNPLNYVRFIAATVMFWVLAGAVQAALAIKTSAVDVDLLATIGNLDMDLSDAGGRIVNRLCKELPTLLNDLLDPLGLEIDPSYMPDYTPAVTLTTGGPVLQKLNLYTLLVSAFCSEQAQAALGFRLDKPETLLSFLVTHIHKKDGGPIFTQPGSILEVLDMNELAHLGDLQVKSGSFRDYIYAQRWTELDEGDYYFVEADTSDVFYFIVRLLAAIFGNETNFRDFLALVGVEREEMDRAFIEMDKDLQEKSGIRLGSLFGDNLTSDSKLDLAYVASHIKTDSLLCLLSEFFLSGGKYDLLELYYAAASDQRQREYKESGSIPYLRYENAWNKDTASLFTDKLDDLLNQVIESFDLDLDPETDGQETVQEFLHTKLRETSVSGTKHMTLMTELFSRMFDETENADESFDHVRIISGIDFSVYQHDFGWLYSDKFAKPKDAEKKFPDISAEKVGDTIRWLWKGKEVTDDDSAYAMLAAVLKPMEPVLDLAFCGKNLKLLRYGEDGGAITVNGGQGYNNVLLPAFEALMGDAAAALPSAKEFIAMGSAAGLAKCLRLISERIAEICSSDEIISGVAEMLIQFMYAGSENGISVLLIDLLQPIWAVVDTLQGVIKLDLDRAANEALCDMLWEVGGYRNAIDMRDALKARNAQLKLRELSVAGILDFFSVVLSAKTESGKRVYLDVADVYRSVIEDLACLREPYSTKSVYTVHGKLTDKPYEAYRLNISGRDAFTVFLSMFVETLLSGENDMILDSLLGVDKLFTVFTALLSGETKYVDSFNWGYPAGADAAAQQELLRKAREDGPVAVEDHRTKQAQEDIDKYLVSYTETDWDQATAEALVDALDDTLTAVLNLKVDGVPLAEKLLKDDDLPTDDGRYTVGSLITDVVSDEHLDNIIGKIANYLDPKREMDVSNEFLAELREMLRDILPYLGDLLRALGVDLSLYNIDAEKTQRENGRVVYYGADGRPTGLERDMLAGDASNLQEMLYELMEPLEDVLSFLLLGKPVDLFYASSDLAVPRGEALVRVSGVQAYEYSLLPLLEPLGFEGLKPVSAYVMKDGTYKADDLLIDLCASAEDWTKQLLAEEDSPAVLNKLLEMLPPLLYFCNANGIGVLLQNLLAPLAQLPEAYNTVVRVLMPEEAESMAITFDTIDELLSHMSVGTLLSTIFAWVPLDGEMTVTAVARNVASILLGMIKGKTAAEAAPDGIHLVLPEMAQRMLDAASIGEVVYNEKSACTFDTYTMRFRSSADKAEFITVLIGMLLDMLEHPDNAEALQYLLGKGVYQGVLNLFHLYDFEMEIRDFPWKLTELADSGELISAFDLSKKLREEPVYGSLWTRKMATELAENIDGIVEDILYLLGIEVNGIYARDFASLMDALLGGGLCSDKSVNKLAALLGKIKPYLDEYDPNGTIANFIKEALDVDLHAWDDYAVGGKYEKGRSWGFYSTDMTPEKADKNLQILEDALCELLEPAAPFLSILLANRDMTLFADADGLGEGKAPIQLTICGAEGYKYAVVPLLEALKVDTKDIYSPEEYTARAVKDNDYAVRGLIHPILSKLDDIADNTAQELFELLPNVIYFLNCGGLGVCVENLLQSVYTIGNALEPMKSQISALVYDEKGLDLYKTIHATELLDQALFDLLGIEKTDLVRIYNQTGRSYTELDSFEDIDFRLILSVLLAKVDSLLRENGINLTVTAFAADLVDELSIGYLRSFRSMSGRTAYCMELDREIDAACAGDFYTLLMRMVFRLLAQKDNLEAFMQLLNSRVKMSEFDYKAVKAVLKVIVSYCAEGKLATETAMVLFYYLVWNVQQGTDAAKDSYYKLNAKWAGVMTRLKLTNPVAAVIVTALLNIFDDEIGNVLTPTQVAPNGLVGAAKQAVQAVKTVVTVVAKAVTSLAKSVKSLFSKR